MAEAGKSKNVICSRCQACLPRSEYPGCTEGYYDVSGGHWEKFAQNRLRMGRKVMEFSKLKDCAELPLVFGRNVFTRQEYQDVLGLKHSGTRQRLAKLTEAGKIRKVRTRRAGTIITAYEYIPQSRKKVTE